MECIVKYLEDVSDENYPRIGVVGIAGPVDDNKVGITVNIPHWPASDGYDIAQKCKFDSFEFINDFTAAGYGVSTLTDSDVTSLNPKGKQLDGAKSVKVVIGPGTGLGQGSLVKGD